MSCDDYPTDDWLMSLFDGWFDPCPLDPNPCVDGLSLVWPDRTFVNPPYSDPLPWVRKAIVESGGGKLVVLLLKVDTSTRWFGELQNVGAHFLWVNGRLKYKTGKPAPFPSMLAILPRKELLKFDSWI